MLREVSSLSLYFVHQYGIESHLREQRRTGCAYADAVAYADGLQDPLESSKFIIRVNNSH